MTSAATPDQIDAALLSAVTNWRRSVERIQLLIDRTMQEGCRPRSPSVHEEFAAALRALYELEAMFSPEQEELQKVA